MLFNRVRDYLLDDEFKMIIFSNKINISNYERIEYLDTDKVIIRYSGGKVCINGSDITVCKLFSQEILIAGDVKEIEMR